MTELVCGASKAKFVNLDVSVRESTTFLCYKTKEVNRGRRLRFILFIVELSTRL